MRVSCDSLLSRSSFNLKTSAAPAPVAEVGIGADFLWYSNIFFMQVNLKCNRSVDAACFTVSSIVEYRHFGLYSFGCGRLHGLNVPNGLCIAQLGFLTG